MTKTIDEVFDAVLDVKGAVVDLKGEFVRLEGHVNDELELMNIAIAKKLDTTVYREAHAKIPQEIAAHFGSKLLNRSVLRWVATATATALLALVVQHNFGGFILHFAEFLVRLTHFI